MVKNGIELAGRCVAGGALSQVSPGKGATLRDFLFSSLIRAKMSC